MLIISFVLNKPGHLWLRSYGSLNIWIVKANFVIMYNISHQLTLKSNYPYQSAASNNIYFASDPQITEVYNKFFFNNTKIEKKRIRNKKKTDTKNKKKIPGKRNRRRWPWIYNSQTGTNEMSVSQRNTHKKNRIPCPSINRFRVHSCYQSFKQ